MGKEDVEDEEDKQEKQLNAKFRRTLKHLKHRLSPILHQLSAFKLIFLNSEWMVVSLTMLILFYFKEYLNFSLESIFKMNKKGHMGDQV